ncbi:MAG TPA: hypothetical protein VMU28_16280 [Terriglobales bacterium]|nr:hypothetical protein [Terriglobales bacterium]
MLEKLKHRIERLTNSEWRRAIRAHEATKKVMPSEILNAHKHCSKHREELIRSDSCGCFYCLKIFAPDEIAEWIDEGQTALCPYCPVDAVIGSASGYSITKESLEEMHGYWF